MLHVEAASIAAAAPGSGAKPTPPDANSDVFASIFASAQRTARIDRSPPDNGRGIASTARRQKQLADTLSKSERPADKPQSSRRTTSGKQSLADRMRESADRSDAKPDRSEPSSHSAEKTPRESLRDSRPKDNDSNSSDGKQDDSIRAEDEVAKNGAETPTQTEQKLEHIARIEQNTSQQHVASASEMAPIAEVQPAVPSPRTNGIGQASVETPGNGADRAQTGPIQNVTAALSPKQSADHQQDAGGSTDVNQAAAEKTGDVPAKPGASVDFQNLLEATARGRGESITARSGVAGTASAKNPLPNGINLDEAESVKQLAQVVRAATSKDLSSMLLKLDPPELGQMRIDVRMHEQTLSLHIETQTQAGHDALQSRLTDLRSALEQHGILVDRMQVDLRPPSTASSNPQDSQPQHHGTSDGDAQFAGSQGQSPDGREGFHSPRDSAESGNPWSGTGLFANDIQDGITRPAGIQSRRVDLVV